MASLLVSGPLTTGVPALASTDSPVRTTVTGVFTDAVTGDPVPGACINLYRASNPSAFYRTHRLARACADASGAYTLPDLPRLATFAYIEAPGYGDQWLGGVVDLLGSTTFFPTVVPTETRNIPLKRMSAGLSVHVTRQDGSPAPNASVAVLSPTGVPVLAGLRTDANGDASRTGLAAGDYKIRFTGAGYLSQWYPGKKTLADGQLVTLKAGETVSLTEQFLPVDPMPAVPALQTVAGVVRAPDGTPIAGATVTVMPINSSLVYGTVATGADGAYTMAVPAGSVVIKVSAPGFATVWNTDDPLPAGSVLTPGSHDFVLRTGSGTIRGAVTDSVAGPIPAYTSLTVTGADGWTYTVVAIGYDGMFEIPNMPPGTYTLKFAPAGRTAQQIDVTVRDGEVTTADLRLLDPGRLRVRVVDDLTGQPIAGATVTAYATQSQVKTSDAQGYAEFGDYWVPTAVQVTATHRPYHFDPQSQTLHPAAGTTTEATIRMRPGAVLTIPVPNADPSYDICADLAGPNTSDGWTTGACELPRNGVLTYGPLQPGTYHAFLRPTNRTVTGAQWVSDSGGTGEERSATVLHLTAGSLNTAPEQRLGPAGSITGKSIDPKTREVVSGCVQFASLPAAYGYGDMGGCTDNTGAYRIDGLGPYAWPLFFNSRAGSPHGSIWSGGATSRLDAKLVQVTSGGTATYDFAPGAAGWFNVQPPANTASWSVVAYDAQTGDYTGDQMPWWSNIGPGPKLLRISYTDQGGVNRTCWMQRRTNLRDERPNGIYYGEPWEPQTRISVVPGKNCLARMPSIVRITPAAGNLKPMFPGRPPTPRQEVSVSGRSGVAGAPSIVATEPETFNELVQSSFDAALQLALGALP